MVKLDRMEDYLKDGLLVWNRNTVSYGEKESVTLLCKITQWKTKLKDQIIKVYRDYIESSGA